MDDSVSVTLPNAALRALATATAETYADAAHLELSIRTADHDLNVRQFSAYLALLDGVYGRLDPAGFRSYAQRPRHQLQINRIGSGSIDLSFLFQLADHVDAWRALLLYLIARAGPSILSGAAAKNWAEAAKAAVDTYRAVRPPRSVDPMSHGYYVKHSDAEEPLRLSRNQKGRLRNFMSSDPSFSKLGDRHRRQLISLVEEVLSRERHRLPAASLFSENYVVEVSLRRREP